MLLTAKGFSMIRRRSFRGLSMFVVHGMQNMRLMPQEFCLANITLRGLMMVSGHDLGFVHFGPFVTGDGVVG